MGRINSYYLDIETYTHGTRPNPSIDKIITIQFQKIDLTTGNPLSPLYILKEWESSEMEIVKKFHKLFFENRKSPFDFVPVGFNLNFELEFLKQKFSTHLGKQYKSAEMYYNTPTMDMKHIAVLLNGGRFYGARLSAFSPKTQNGNVIKYYYTSKRFDEIERYIKEETEAFITFYKRALKVAKESRHQFVFSNKPTF